jgi:hypothetical protein
VGASNGYGRLVPSEPSTAERLISVYPRLYHMAADRAWPSIQRHGLLSTSAILDLAGIEGERRERIEASRRRESVSIPNSEGQFVLRDQKPLDENKLASSLVDMTVPEWLKLLNGLVFFWPTIRRCEDLLGARAYRDGWHTIIEFDTARLLTRHDVLLSPINAGAVLYDPPPRGTFTFSTVEEFPFDEYRRRRKSAARAVAEVAVRHSVPGVGALAERVWRARRDDWTPVV